MNNFKKGGFSKGPRSFSSFGKKDNNGFRGNGGGRDRDRSVSMHPAVCSQCGKKCEVPFRPTGDKPVFCSECFGGSNNSYDKKPSFEREERRPSFENRRDSGGSRFGNRDFQKVSRDERPTENNNELKKQIDVLNSKLDMLIGLFKKEDPKEDKNIKAKDIKEKTPKKENTIKKEVKKEKEEKPKKISKVIKEVVKKTVKKVTKKK
jgi:CxxC-x17-CxxC domain-containing protein